MKKLLIISISSGIIFWMINIFVYYFLNYPANFIFYEVLKKNVEWKLLIFIYISLISISVLFSLLFFKKRLFFKKFYTSIISFNIIGIIIILIIGTNRYIDNKKDFEKILIKFRKDAEIDVKNDNVKYFSQGLLLSPRTEREKNLKNETKRLLGEYGLHHRSLGCTVMPQVTKAKDEYIRITDIYLNKRNGNGWRIKMKKEMDSIYKRQ